MTSKSAQNILTLLIVLLLVLAGTFAAYRFLVKGTGLQQSDNPYEYDIKEFKNVPAELVHYSEIKRISCSEPHAIAIDNHDRLYIADSARVRILSPQWDDISSFSIPNIAYCITVDTAGQIYTGYNNHVTIFDRSGNPLQQIELPLDNSSITSISVSNDFIYIADFGEQIIHKLDKNGRPDTFIGEKDESKGIPGFVIPSPYFDIAIDEDGFLWAANPGRTRLENYTPDGDLRAFWGISSMELEGFSGCCNPANFAFLADGSFVTSEKGLARIKVYDRAGQLRSVVAGPMQFHDDTPAMDIAVDSQDRIYVADLKSKSVRIFQHKAAGN